MSKYAIIVFLALCFYKSHSQEFYTDSILVTAQKLSFKKDTGASNVYVLYFDIGMSPVAAVDSVQFSFLDISGNVIGDYGIYGIATHANGSYYLHSAQGNKINVVNDHISVCLPFSVNEYNNYISLRVQYSSTSNISEMFLYTIPKY
jgi:hypothetical protein